MVHSINHVITTCIYGLNKQLYGVVVMPKDKIGRKIIKEKGSMRLQDVRNYNGILTGQTVKPAEGWENELKQFQNGDRVVVFHFEDFNKFLHDLEK